MTPYDEGYIDAIQGEFYNQGYLPYEDDNGNTIFPAGGFEYDEGYKAGCDAVNPRK